MKISKLFHWLYASLMLLPLMVFGVTGLYYGLNQNAQLSERTETTENYYLKSNPNYSYQHDELQYNTLYIVTLQNTEGNYAIENFDYFTLINMTERSIYMTTYDGDLTLPIEVEFDGADLYWYDQYCYYDLKLTIDEEYQFVFVMNNNITADSYYEFFSDIGFMSILGCDLDIHNGEYTSATYTNDISTSIINAWNSTWQNPLFSWSSDSFLIAPFNYITDLFSIPQNNTFSMALSYWLAISIVYLVFDLVMYVPLLAHRWIDKGMVE